MNKPLIVRKTADFVKSKLEGESTGHDWWHIYRVWKMAKHLASKEKKADLFVVELAALLHDISDWKFNGGDLTAGSKVSRKWLSSLKVEEAVIDYVCQIIDTISFKGSGVKAKNLTLEGMIVQDADRLDAIGAIGIARTFAYGGNKNREIHNPTIKPKKHRTFEQYKNSNSHTINHFYEKLLLLKDRMNTKTAKKLALNRHKFMEEYLKRFFKEWEGEI